MEDEWMDEWMNGCSGSHHYCWNWLILHDLMVQPSQDCTTTVLEVCLCCLGSRPMWVKFLVSQLMSGNQLQFIHVIFLPRDAVCFVRCTRWFFLFFLSFSSNCNNDQYDPTAFVSSDQMTFLLKGPAPSAVSVIWSFWVVLEQRFLSCWLAFKFMFLKVMFYCGCRYFCTHILQHPHIKRFIAIVLGFALFTPKYVYL